MLKYWQEAKRGLLTKAHTKELTLCFPNYVLKLLISSSQSDRGMVRAGMYVSFYFLRSMQLTSEEDQLLTPA